MKPAVRSPAVPPIYRNPRCVAARSSRMEGSLAELFRRLVQSTILTTAVVTGGCASSHRPDHANAGSGGSAGTSHEGGSGSSGAGGSAGASGSGGMGGASGASGASGMAGAGGDGGSGGGGSEFGGSGGSAGGDVDAAIGMPPDCTTDAGYRAAHGLMPVSAPTYVGAHVMQQNAGTTPATIFVQDSVGAACSDAGDMPACHAALDDSTGVTFNECGQAGCAAFMLTSTDGDAAAQYRTVQELIAFLGEIDTAQEAFLVARYHGYFPECQGRSGAREAAGGWELTLTNEGSCDSEFFTFTVRVERDGTLTETQRVSLGLSNVDCGRRPDGLRSEAPRREGSELMAYLTSCSHLEAAAVVAFENLALELLHHGAPRALVDAALRSAAEEREHTAFAEELCARYGATPARPSLDPSVVRGLFAIAEDNAIEGCVRETYGALLAHYQAEHAEDPAIARTMRRIAEDETRHAELAWALGRWLTPRLDAHDRADVDTRRRQAIAELRAEITRSNDPTLRSRAGIPDPLTAAALLDRLERELWHTAPSVRPAAAA